MIEPISWLTVIGLCLYLTIISLQWWSKINDRNQKRKDEIDKEINSASSFDDFVRIDDKLRNK